MATILQLSETTYLNLDTVTVLRCEDGQWRVFFNDHAHALTLTDEETAVLALYLRNHTERATYHAYTRRAQEVTHDR
jgi:hypothetical protein